MSRPRFHEDKAERLLQALRAGVDDSDACRFADVHPATYERWLDRRDFGPEVRRAKAEIAILAAGTLRQHARSDPKVAETVLERQRQQDELVRLRRIAEASE